MADDQTTVSRIEDAGGLCLVVRRLVPSWVVWRELGARVWCAWVLRWVADRGDGGSSQSWHLRLPRHCAAADFEAANQIGISITAEALAAVHRARREECGV